MLMLLSVICLFFILLRVMLMRDHPNAVADGPKFSPREPFETPVQMREPAPEPEIVETQAEISNRFESSAHIPSESENPRPGLFATDLYPHSSPSDDGAADVPHLASLTPPPGATSLGVVDLKRLYGAHPPDSPGARASWLQHTKQIVASRAVVHGFAYVFDRSADTMSVSPFVLNADGVEDITDEVLQELSQ
jgi:hypothetical protein